MYLITCLVPKQVLSLINIESLSSDSIKGGKESYLWHGGGMHGHGKPPSECGLSVSGFQLNPDLPILSLLTIL